MSREAAEDEMCEGYRDGRNPDMPCPGPNQSAAYRHGFQSGRDDLNRQPSAPASVRRAEAKRILAEAES